MGYSARPLSTNSLFELVNLTAHGFSVGQLVIYDGAWVLAKANSLVNCAGTMMVAIVPTVNTFYVVQTGYISNLTTAFVDGASITTGVQYYLSHSTAGNLTASMPVSSGLVNLACFVFDSSTTGYFYGGSGELIETGPLFAWTTATTNTNMGTNQGYFTSSGGTLNMTLPPTGSVAKGDVIRLSNLAGNFSLLTNASQTINFGDDVVSTSITSSKVGDSLELVCYVASPNALFQVLSSMGNLTFV